jgi:GTP-binding protein
LKKSQAEPIIFLLSAVKVKQLPADIGHEIAFIGYSNVGKSSALNTIFANKKLARVSNTPGRTQAMNVFQIDAHRRVVDLPGYGYAKVPEKLKRQWQQEINQYLRKRHSLKGLVLVADIRHDLKVLDKEIITWAHKCRIPVHLLLTKVDKLKHSERLRRLAAFTKAVEHWTGVTLQAFSSLTKEGMEEALVQLDTWFVAEE